MKNKLLLLILLTIILVFSINQYAQIYQKYEDGTTILINLNTTQPINEATFGDKLRMWQIRIPNMNRIVRCITNENSGFYIGYILDYEIVGEKKYKVSIKPIDRANDPFPYKSEFHFRELKQYPGDIIVNDGDIIVLDLLENSTKEIKTQDLILITKEPLTSRNYFSDLQKPKDFQINDIKLRLEEFKVLMNGIPLQQKSLFKVEGHILAFHFKDKGEIFLSLFPQKGYNFQRVGTVDGKVMSFKMNDDTYEINSLLYILDDEEVKWNLWGYYVPEEKLKDKVPDSLEFKGRIINRMP